MTRHTVWLASYPKSGNTWVRALLTALEHGEELDLNHLGHGPIAGARAPLREWLGLPSTEFTIAELARLRLAFDAHLDTSLTEVRFRKIHDGLFTGVDDGPIVPPGATRGAVYIVRDPRAVAPSLAHHLDVEVARSVELMNKRVGVFNALGKANSWQLPQRLGTWSEHVGGWCQHDMFPVLLVRYEDLHADPVAQLGRIVEFAGLSYEAAQLAAAVRAAEFSRLRSREEHEGFRERSFSGVFFRRGETESWREELPSELVARIEEAHAETMERLGYQLESVLV